MDTVKTLAWINTTVEKAFQESRAGNPILLNRLGQNAALQHYINNIHTRHVMTPEQWSQQYYPYMQEADRLRTEYDALQEAVASSQKITALESKLDELHDMVKTLVANQQPAAGGKKPAKAETPAPSEGSDAPDTSEGA